VPTILVALPLAITVLHREKKHFSYTNSSVCFSKFVPLPNLQKTTQSASYELRLDRPFRLGGVTLFSRQACAVLKSLPAENGREVLDYSFMGNKFIKQVVAISTPAFPNVNVDALSKKPLAVGESLVLPTGSGEVVFDYVLAANKQEVTCNKTSQNIICPVKQLGLSQGETYQVSLSRRYQNQSAGTVYDGQVRTATPVEVVSSTIPSGSTVLDKPSELRLTTNKKLTSFKDISLVSGAGTSAKATDITTTIENERLIVHFNKDLERDVDYTLTVNDLVAEDKGQLNQPYSLQFHTSGGPRVATTNTATYGVAVNQSFSVTFDQDLLPGQNFAALISVTTDQGAVPTTVSVSGRRVTLSPTANLPKCTTFTITVNSNVQSIYGIGGSSAWSLRSRTQCVTVSVIGYSVQGRAIYAYRFGSGASKVIYVGNMHGNEKSSKYLLDRWIDELEANPGRIPANRSLIIIPSSNPDGFAANVRLNANGVDLNRNFPADDWSSSATVPGPQTLPQGGGSAPLSEPESSALASFVLSEQPRLVLTFHSRGSVVIANGAGDSGALANVYANNSPYWVASDGSADEVFGYPTTGEFEDWLYDKHNIPALLIEMTTDTSSEFSGNRNALWAMATLP
jgi:protein MpaA